MHNGLGPGLPNRELGEKGGSASVAEGDAGFLAVNFIIVLEGIYPSRS